jgi:hypothetical protein
MFYDIKFFSNNKFEIKRFFNYFSDKFILSENIILTITFKESEFYEKHYCKHKIIQELPISHTQGHTK